MVVSDLTLNVLNFALPEQRLTCYVTPQPHNRAICLSLKDKNRFVQLLALPENTKGLYATLKREDEEAHEVTQLLYRRDGEEPLWSYSFLKKYYTFCLSEYFRSKGLPVKTDFVSDTEVWVPSSSPYARCDGYRVFRLRVQFSRITQNPELVVSWCGIRSVSQMSMLDLSAAEIPASSVSRVMYEGSFYSANELPESVRRNLDRAYPCMSRNLQKALNIETPAPDKSNRYIRYWNEIESFKNDYLLVADFQAVLAVGKGVWVAKTPRFLASKMVKTNHLMFGNGSVADDPNDGLKSFGPKHLAPDNKTVFFYLCHTDDAAMAKTVHQYMLGEKSGFVGLYRYVNLNYGTVKGFSIYFNDRRNPLPEIEEQLNARKFQADTRYVALYLSPHSKWGSSDEEKSIYYKVKELLLHRGIVSQAIEVEKNWLSKEKDESGNAILNEGFKFAFANIAVALLAKLGGTPWSLADNDFRELVIGVSAFKNESLEKRYLGSAFSFSNAGQFYGFDCFRSNQTLELAGAILLAVKAYCNAHATLDRLVIHFYKILSRKELQPIEEGLARLNLQIPVIVVSLNKSFSEDVLGFDASQSHKMPPSGAYFPLGKNEYLLYNNSLLEDKVYKSTNGYPFPLKVSILSYAAQSAEGVSVAEDAVPALLHQICQFSQLYWKSISKQSLPVTLKYSEMLAQIVPHFDRSELPKTGRESLWFL